MKAPNKKLIGLEYGLKVSFGATTPAARAAAVKAGPMSIVGRRHNVAAQSAAQQANVRQLVGSDFGSVFPNDLILRRVGERHFVGRLAWR